MQISTVQLQIMFPLIKLPTLVDIKHEAFKQLCSAMQWPIAFYHVFKHTHICIFFLKSEYSIKHVLQKSSKK